VTGADAEGVASLDSLDRLGNSGEPTALWIIDERAVGVLALVARSRCKSILLHSELAYQEDHQYTD
jgi:hypothetical protein